MIITFLIALVKWWIFSIFRKNWHLKITKTDQTDKPMACGLSTEMELELESMGVWGETLTGIPGEKTLRGDLLKEPTANSTHTASTRLTFHMQVNLPGIEFLGTKPKLRKRKRNSSKCAYVPRGGISRCTRAVTSKKCTKKVRCTYRVVVSGPFCFCFCFFFLQIKASLSQTYRSTGRIFNWVKNMSGHVAHTELFNILLCSHGPWTATRL